MFQQNSFVPLPAFSQRVQYVANGGLTLRHVTPGDSGNYSVDVTTQDTSGTSFNKFHYIILSVTGIHNVFLMITVLAFTSLHLSHSLFDRWGTKDDRATTVLHSSLFSAFRRASPNLNPVHSVMLSSHLFFCLPLLLPPCTVPCRIIFASPVDLVLCPYHLRHYPL